MYFHHVSTKKKICALKQNLFKSGVCNRAERGAAANSGGRSAGGKLSIRRRRKGPRQE